MVNTLTIPETLSLETFLALPETKPAQEYFNSHIYQKPMPQGKHSKLQITLASQINQQAESKRIAYAFTELRCTFAGRSLVPDITVFEWDHIPLDENGEILNKITIAPDWIIEISSPFDFLISDRVFETSMDSLFSFRKIRVKKGNLLLNSF